MAAGGQEARRARASSTCATRRRRAGRTTPRARTRSSQVAEQTGAAVHVDHITEHRRHPHDAAGARQTLEAPGPTGSTSPPACTPTTSGPRTSARPGSTPAGRTASASPTATSQIAGTGERLTESTFNKYQAQNKLAAAYAIPEDDVVTGLQTDWTMIGSDAILEPATTTTPASTGCFTRVLGRYVRDQQALIALPDALAKMTILPARRFEDRVPALRKKGRLQMGADADITIFDPATVADASTVENPAPIGQGHRVRAASAARSSRTGRA